MEARALYTAAGWFTHRIHGSVLREDLAAAVHPKTLRRSRGARTPEARRALSQGASSGANGGRRENPHGQDQGHGKEDLEGGFRGQPAAAGGNQVPRVAPAQINGS